MPIYNEKLTLSDTEPTKLVSSDNQRQVVHLHNMSKVPNQYIHIGNAEMTLTNSPHIDPSETVTYEIEAGDELFGMSDPDGVAIGILRITQD